MEPLPETPEPPVPEVTTVDPEASALPEAWNGSHTADETRERDAPASEPDSGEGGETDTVPGLRADA
jgi:hypothetical protein